MKYTTFRSSGLSFHAPPFPKTSIVYSRVLYEHREFTIMVQTAAGISSAIAKKELILSVKNLSGQTLTVPKFIGPNRVYCT